MNARRALAFMVLAGCAPALQAQVAPVQMEGVARVIAFGDVHGAYNDLHELLRSIGVLDAQDRWAADKAQVVSTGDLLDRGADSRKVMDLLMRLQEEARAAGGAVRVLLGNHEAMNLLGDLRYVEVGEYAAYTDLETPAMREEARKNWQGGQCAAPCASFNQKFPPGYFGHRAAFEPEGRYGKWLLAQSVAIRINDSLFLHAGTGPALRGLSLPDLNLRYRTAITEYLGLARQLAQAGLLQPGDAYEDRPRLAHERLAARSVPDEALLEALGRFDTAAANPLLSEDGPNWYRGDALCNEVVESDTLLPLLQQYGVARVVVGHTPTRDSRVVTRFDGRVVKIDTGMNRAAYRGKPAALFITPGGMTVRYAGETGEVAPQAEGLFVAPTQVADSAVAAALRDGEVSVTGSLSPDQMNVQVTQGGARIPAVFLVRDAQAIGRELAAYRLDRLLGLGLVPATVQREVQGQRGILQARPSKWVTQAGAQQQGLRGGGWCALQPQFQLMYAFDVLSGNEARTADSIVMDSADWYVYGTGFGKAFGTGSDLPAYLKAQPPAPGAEIRRRAGGLDEAKLKAELGQWLDAKELRAILARRDHLLALPAPAAATGR